MQILQAVAEAIRGLGRVPSGELYASIMGTLDIQTYERIIAILKGSGVIREENYELIWNLPKEN